MTTMKSRTEVKLGRWWAAKVTLNLREPNKKKLLMNRPTRKITENLFRKEMLVTAVAGRRGN